MTTDELIFERILEPRKKRLESRPNDCELTMRFIHRAGECPINKHVFDSCIGCDYTEQLGVCYYPVNIHELIVSKERRPMNITERMVASVDRAIALGELRPESREAAINKALIEWRRFRDAVADDAERRVGQFYNTTR